MPPVLAANTTLGPVKPGLPLSIFDPVPIGIDEFGMPVLIRLIWRNLLIGGEPGAGKSALLNVLVAYAALCANCRLILLDGKQVELGQWRKCADAFVGPNIVQALVLLTKLQKMMDNRYAFLLDCERRKVVEKIQTLSPVTGEIIWVPDAFLPYVVAIDEIAYYSATIGDKRQREEFAALLRDLVARGRAVGIIVIAATQRPSSDIIPTSLRDLFAWRFAGRCTNDSSSDIVLGHGWAQKNWSANSISPNNPGAGLLIAEGGSPQLVKTAYLDDRTCAAIAAYAADMRATVTAADRRALRAVPAAA
ncbi:FtsK/SpoIIIE domain-containing protein [Couchioplanes caeruleus]|uniref:S-DNA-T family DNA segregation ATPase FtsK/SpoIIIE n=1 Tax=Couchioplanes caeruleus TaxID=56438 RepID=A0A3N1GTR9_9ACTN|nr:FtsK/SpoIIIE domain-containing protein [Couchioplanes caeruleus]ROP33506.1 S-DNA-T family DNA segregation ATPase FtsK/SpoIIIE [Couchioplanes caeruleus]